MNKKQLIKRLMGIKNLKVRDFNKYISMLDKYVGKNYNEMELTLKKTSDFNEYKLISFLIYK